MDIPDYKEKYGEPETLEEILNYCAFIMGQCGLEHRTLHHFNWFVHSIIFGKSEFESTMMKWLSDTEDDPAKDPVMTQFSRDLAKGTAEDALKVYHRYHLLYNNNNHEILSTYANAFKEYCEEEYLKDDDI